MKHSLMILALLSAFSASAAHAETGAALAVSGGTTGLGLHLVIPYDTNTSFRVGINGYDYSTTGTTEDAEYSLQAKLRTVDALVDYFPSAGAFRLTGGLIYNGNKVNLTARPNEGGSYIFNGRLYSVSEVGEVNGDMDFNKVAPYLGIGFGNAAAKNKGWGFTADLGVMFQGKPDVTLTNSNCTADPRVCSELADDLATENEELRKEAEDFRYYPVVRVGVSYRF
jgi:hypothetical protein